MSTPDAFGWLTPKEMVLFFETVCPLENQLQKQREKERDAAPSGAGEDKKEDTFQAEEATKPLQRKCPVISIV